MAADPARGTAPMAPQEPVRETRRNAKRPLMGQGPAPARADAHALAGAGREEKQTREPQEAQPPV